MTEPLELADHFEKSRSHLRRVAYRMLGSRAEADDALQEAWMRVARAGPDDVSNLGGWLTTVVARVCLDMLRSRRESPLPDSEGAELAGDPETDLELADALGPALLVVLQALAPAERVAFVLHDMFDMTFEEIAPIVSRSPAATRQLASRGRRRIRGGSEVKHGELVRHREIVSAFLAASRAGKFEALLAVLAPDVVLRADDQAVATAAAHNWGGAQGLPSEVGGAVAVAQTLNGRARGVRQALIDGAAGAVVAQGGRTLGAWLFTIEDEKIVEVELVMEPVRLAQLHVSTDA